MMLNVNTLNYCCDNELYIFFRKAMARIMVQLHMDLLLLIVLVLGYGLVLLMMMRHVLLWGLY